MVPGAAARHPDQVAGQQPGLEPHRECVVMDEDAVSLLQLHQYFGAEGGAFQAVDHQDE